MGKRRGLIVLMMLALIGLTFVSPDPALAAPALSVNPVSGTAGSTVIQVDGAGFTPGFPPCQVFFDGAKEADCTVDQNGTFSVTFVVPVTAGPGSGQRVSACSYCGQGDLEEAATALFTVDPPPPTTTIPPPTTTTAPPTTTIPAPTTTTSPPTTIPATDTPAIDPDFGLGPGISGTSTVISVVDGLIDIPDVWIARCAPPQGATIWGFDDQRPGARAHIRNTDLMYGTVVEPEHGTLSAPYALRVVATESGATWQTRMLTPTRYVGMYVGLVDPADGPVTVRLTARDAHRDDVDIDEIVLGPDPSPANVCMLVRARTYSGVASVKLTAFTSDNQPVRLDIDDMFSGADPYPFDGGYETADMEMIFPASGTRIDAGRRTPIIGRITLPSTLSLIGGIRIVLPNWDRTEMLNSVAQLGPPTYSEDGSTLSRLFWLDGVRIPPGPVTVNAATAAPGFAGAASLDLIGTGPPALPESAYVRSVASKVDIVPWAMEITQAIRGPLEVQRAGSRVQDDFRLVEGKKTVVRGYSVQTFPTGPAPARPQPLSIAARLYGFRDGVSLPGSPLMPETAERVDVVVGEPGMLAEARSRPFADRTWNFLLPYTWTTGDVTLRMEVNPSSAPGQIAEAPFADGYVNTLTRSVTFRDTGRISAFPTLVEFFWRCTQDQIDLGRNLCAGAGVGDIKSASPTEEQARTSLAQWWRVLPARGDLPYFTDFGGVKLTQRNPSSSIPLGSNHPLGVVSGFSWSDLKSAFTELYCNNESWFPTKVGTSQMRTFAYFLTPPDAPIGGGCAWVGEPTMFRTTLFWGTLAQEAAHTTGLRHSGEAHGEKNGRQRWPGDHGEIAPPERPAWGFDTTRMAVVMDPSGGHVHDYLSYGPAPIWTSVATWNHMFDALLENHPSGDRRGRAASNEGTEVPSGAQGDDGGERVVVNVAVRESGLALARSYLGEGEAFDLGDPIEVSLLDEEREPIGTVRGWVLPGPTHAVDAGYLVRVDLPSDSPAVGLALPDGKTVMSSGVTPAVDGLVAEVTDDKLSVTWIGNSSDGFVVEASRDAGAWWTIGSSEEPALDIDLNDLFLDGEGWRIRVQASDGMRVASATVDSVNLGELTPVAMISTPLEGDFVRSGIIRATAGIGSVGTSEAITYRWSLDGQAVGDGREVPIPLVVPGRHEISLTVIGPTDESTDSISVSVITDTDADGMDDQWEIDHGLDPLDSSDGPEDPDGDGLQNLREFEAGTDPLVIDTDGDGYDDLTELEGGTDPIDPSQIPSFLHGIPGTPALSIADMQQASEPADTVEVLDAADSEDSSRSRTPLWLLLAVAGSAAGVGGALVIRRRRGKGPEV